jgi:N-acetylmuramic acid 6-phosphate etherase
MDINNLETEQPNPASEQIDRASTEEIVRIIHREDHKVAPAVEKVLPQIAQAVDIIYAKIHGAGGWSIPVAGLPGVWACWTRWSARHVRRAPGIGGRPDGRRAAGLREGRGGCGGRPRTGQSRPGGDRLFRRGRAGGHRGQRRTPYVLGALEYAVSLARPRSR